MSTREIQSVVVIGGSGNIGGPIIDALLKASFRVTAITRPTSSSQFPPSVTVHQLDLSSKSALISVLQGHDAVVSLLSRYAIDQQPLVIDAAIEAGVSRFIPSDFGIDNRMVGNHRLAYQIQRKIKTQDYLSEKAAQYPGFSWTGLGIGLLFDYGMKHLIGADIETRTMTIFDSGNEPFQATNIGLTAKAVVAILQRPAETANQYLSIASFNTTQNETLRILESLTSGLQWTVKHVNSANLQLEGDKKRDAGTWHVLEYLKLFAFADGSGHALKEEQSANALLGLEKEDVRESLERILQTS
ncbi:hypothetical protein V8C35DRAFT_331404 [Trichoderma chlorosporum]